MKYSLLTFSILLCSLLSANNPNNAYIRSSSPGNGCVVCDNYNAGDLFSLDGGVTTYTVVDRALLDQMIQQNADLSKVCTSLLADMSYLFLNDSSFNQDISSWDVSNVTDMTGVFANARSFNQDISNWDVDSVITMLSIFYYAEDFNQPIGQWDVSRVMNFKNAFSGAISFNQDIGTWNTSSALDMSHMFDNNSVFDQDIGSWNVSSVMNMDFMFSRASSFNQDLRTWDVSNVTSMYYTFAGASAFNQDISFWNVGGVSNMEGMFREATAFNQDLTGWCVDGFSSQPSDFDRSSGLSFSNLPVWGTCPEAYFNNSGCLVCSDYAIGSYFSLDYGQTYYRVVDRQLLEQMRNQEADLSLVCVSAIADMHELFLNDNSFNDDIGTWDVSNVTNMEGMFSGASSFNQSIGNWDVSNVLNMEYMFNYAEVFNQDIDGWNVSNVESMKAMFFRSLAFNQDLNSWNVSRVKDMSMMFSIASSFDGQIGNWNTDSVQNMSWMFADCSSFNQDIGNWNLESVLSMNSMFHDASVFNQDISAWNVSNVSDMHALFSGASSFNQDVSTWDVSSVNTMRFLFKDASSFDQNIGNWTVFSVTDMTGLFQNASSFDQDLTSWCVENIAAEPSHFASGSALSLNQRPNWGASCIPVHQRDVFNPKMAYQKLASPGFDCIICDAYAVGDSFSLDAGTTWYKVVDKAMLQQKRDNGDDLTLVCTSKVTSMSNVFFGRSTFNQDISNWDMSNVTSTYRMFYNASSFDRSIGQWEMDAIETMQEMFKGASSFNRSIGDWQLDSVTSMKGLFRGASSFNQEIGNWNVSKVGNMEEMFFGASSFNKDLSQWDVSSVTRMSNMFLNASNFNREIGLWDVSQVTDMQRMFFGASRFNKDIGYWDVGSVTNMYEMFFSASNFNQDLTRWCVSNFSVSPIGFAFQSNLDISNEPLWGTCPIRCELELDSVMAVNHNQGVYKAHFSNIQGSGDLFLEWKDSSEVSWSSKPVFTPSSGFQKFNIGHRFNSSVEIRLIQVLNGVRTEGCSIELVTPCKSMTIQVHKVKNPFCEGDSALVRVGFSGGYRNKNIQWNNGKTSKFIYVQQGQKAVATVTDESGCSVKDSIEIPLLNSHGSPSNLQIQRNGANFYCTWNAAQLNVDQYVVFYRVNYRLRGTTVWQQTPTVSDTVSTFSWIGSGNPAGNYEFMVVTRIADNSLGTKYTSSPSCIALKGYNGIGGKMNSNGNHEIESSIGVFPNPTNGMIYVNAPSGSDLTLTDVNGKEVWRKVSMSDNTEADISYLSSGVYLLRITTEKTSQILRIVKE